MFVIIVAGNLTRDPEVYESSSGRKIVHIRVAGNYAADGQKQTVFARCSLFGKDAEIGMRYLHKGYPVTVIGPGHIKLYQGSDGAQHVLVQVAVDKLELHGKASDSAPNPTAIGEAEENVPAGYASVSEKEDLPW